MALTGTITIKGGSAGAVFHDHGSVNFSPFTKFSAFLSDQFAFSSSGYTEIDSGTLTLKSKEGNLVFSDKDTISASYGGDTVISGSVSISFVFGSATTSLFSTPFSDTLGGASSALSDLLAAASKNVSLGGAASTLANLEHELLKPAGVTSVAAASSAVAPTPALTNGVSINLGDAKATIVTMHKPTTDKA